MNDQEKSNFLKAKLLAEKGKTEKSLPEPSEKDMKNIAKGIDTVLKFSSYVIFFASLYASQLILCERWGITAFTFLESFVLYFAGMKSLSILGKFLIRVKQ